MFDAVCVHVCMQVLSKYFNTPWQIEQHSLTICRFITFNSGRVCVCICVFSVHRTSQEWETSEYSNSLLCKTRVNAACHKLLRECGYGIVHLPVSSLFNPVASWVLSSLPSPAGQKSCHQWTWRG